MFVASRDNRPTDPRFASDSGSARASPPPIGVYAQGVGSADMSMYAQSVPQMSYGQVPLQVRERTLESVPFCLNQFEF